MVRCTRMGQIRLEVMPTLAPLFGGEPSQHLAFSEPIEAGETVRDLLNRLAKRHERLGGLVFSTETQQLSGNVRLVLNSRLIELVGGLDTCLETGDEILFLPAFSGG